MSVVVVRPDATSVAGATLVGGATTHAVLADDSDASYAQSVSGAINVGFANPTIPAGAIIKSAAARIRQSVASTGPTWGVVSGELSIVQILVGTTTILTLSTGSAAAPSAATLNATTMSVSWGNNPGAVAARLYEVYLDVTYVAKPVIVVNNPTGTITTTNMPLVSWTNTLDADGGPQLGYRVKIFSAAQYGAGGFDPATSTPTLQAGGGTDPLTHVIGATPSWQPTTPLADGTYRAYVHVFQNVVPGTASVPVSDWTYSQFTIDVDLPAVPTITVTAQPASGRNQIVLSSNAGTATTDALDLERSLDAGVTWVPVRHAAGLLSRVTGTSGTFYDREAPNGVAVLYRARALHNYSGLYAASAWTASASGTWTSTAWWLKAPNTPGLNQIIELVTYGDVTWPARQGIFAVLGASRPTVVRDVRGAAQGSSTIRTNTDAARDLLLDVAAADMTLLLQGPLAAGEPDRYISVGDLTQVRMIENVNKPRRTFTLPWHEVVQPDGAAV